MDNKILGQRDLLLATAELLDKSKLPYLLSGSFASSYWGRPRATHDIDFVIEVKRENLKRLAAIFAKLGKDFDAPSAKELGQTEKPQMISVYHFDTAIKMDFWLTGSKDFIGKYKRKKVIEINRRPVSIVSAEDLILTKLEWCRRVPSERHLGDCIGIWRIQKRKLDEKYLRRKAEELKVVDLLTRVATTTEMMT